MNDIVSEIHTQGGTPEGISDSSLMTWYEGCKQDALSKRDRKEPVWEENFRNYMAEPFWQSGSGSNPQDTTDPLNNLNSAQRRQPGRSIMMDGESHQIVETISGKLILALLAPYRNYIRSSPVGREDVLAGRTVDSLLKYCINMTGHYLEIITWVKDSLIFGMGWLEVGVHSNGVDPDIKVLSVYDVLVDPAAKRWADVRYVMKRVRMSIKEAEALVDEGVFDGDVVKEAVISSMGDRAGTDEDDDVIQALLGYSISDLAAESGYVTLEGWEMWTTSVPWKPEDNEDARVITFFDGAKRPARNDPNPFNDRKIPIIPCRVRPISHDIYGISPLTVTRYHQDHTNSLLMARTDAAIREAKGIYEIVEGMIEDPNKILKGFNDGRLFVEEKGAITPLKMEHSLQAAHVEVGVLKQAMRQISGAQDPVQGIGVGGSQTATETAIVANNAIGRIEVDASIMEREPLPLLAELIHSRYAQFSTDQSIIDRCGTRPQPATVAQIQGKFNFEFTGARLAMTAQQRTAAMREAITVLGSIPMVAAQVDWNTIISKYIEEGLHLKDFEEYMPNAAGIANNVRLLQQLQGGGSGGQGTATGGSGGSVPAQQQRPQDEGRAASDVGGLLT